MSERTMTTNPHEVPVYTATEAARYLHLAPATLRSWAWGRPYPRQTNDGYFAPILQVPDPQQHRLSFLNLVEAHVLRALRTEHAVSVRAVREALRIAEAHYGLTHLLASRVLYTSAGELFLKTYRDLVHLDRSGQFTLETILERYLKRVEWTQGSPTRLYPYLDDPDKVIAIDPRIAFGRPILISHGISTSVIVSRYEAGEPLDAIAEDYDLDLEEVTTAMLFERAA